MESTGYSVTCLKKIDGVGRNEALFQMKVQIWFIFTSYWLSLFHILVSPQTDISVIVDFFERETTIKSAIEIGTYYRHVLHCERTAAAYNGI